MHSYCTYLQLVRASIQEVIMLIINAVHSYCILEISESYIVLQEVMVYVPILINTVHVLARVDDRRRVSKLLKQPVLYQSHKPC